MLQRLSALVLIGLPFAGLVWAAAWVWDDGVSRTALAVAAGMYVLTGNGLSVGFHRMLTHRSFRPRRALKIALAIAGSMAAEGSAFTWVAQHRRHHAYADTLGDPHSPWRYGSGFCPQLRGLWHAQVGWFFETNPSQPERWIPDLLADADLQIISRTATLWVLLSLAVPTALGWLLTGTLTGALATLLGPGACASSCCITSPGRSTQSDTCSAAAPSAPATAAPTSRRSHCSASAIRGTTPTTPTPDWHGTESTEARSTLPPS
jgi:stearoyl-CoA desaturase (delta-9 desaturase)